MGKTYPEIDDSVRAFIQAQRMFFVSTAPLSAGGHINLSPKGLDTFRVLGPRRVAYLDYTGSGVETIAHIRENGRLTIMFCAFEGRPNILRLYGKGRVVEVGDAEFTELFASGWGAGAGLTGNAADAGSAPSTGTVATAGVRAIIVLEVTRLMDSCGFGVPRYEYVGERDQMVLWAERKGAEGVRAYQREKNGVSMDGLGGLRVGR